MSEMLSKFCRRKAASQVPEDYGFNVEWNLAGDMAAALETKLEAMEPLVEVAREAERIANEAHLAADNYAYDLMKTVLFQLVGYMERSVEQALAAQQEEKEWQQSPSAG